MAYTDSLSVVIRVRDGDFLGMGNVVNEHVEGLPHDLGESVSLDAVYDIAHGFRRALYIDNELGHELTIDDMPTAVSIAVTDSTVDQGGDSGHVTVIVELLSERVWDLWIGLLGAWLYDQLKKGRTDDE